MANNRKPADRRLDNAAANQASAEDAELVSATCAGDVSAFAELVRRHKREILVFVSRFCQNAAQADDLGQDVFCKAYENLQEFKGKSSFRTWLYRIASNTCVDHLRQRQRLDQRERHVPEQEPPHAGHGSREAMESRIDCQRLLAHLSPTDRLLVTLLYVEGCSVKETAALSGLSAANIRVRAFRARARLRRLMEEQHE